MVAGKKSLKINSIHMNFQQGNKWTIIYLTCHPSSLNRLIFEDLFNGVVQVVYQGHVNFLCSNNTATIATTLQSWNSNKNTIKTKEYLRTEHFPMDKNCIYLTQKIQVITTGINCQGIRLRDVLQHLLLHQHAAYKWHVLKAKIFVLRHAVAVLAKMSPYVI